MLSASHLLQIVLTTALCTAVVTAVVLLSFRIPALSGIAPRSVVAVAGALTSVGASTFLIAHEMYLSGQDELVLAWVLSVSAVMSLGAGWFVTSRVVRTSAAALEGATGRVGDGDVVARTATGVREFDVLSARLADASERLADARAQIDELDRARRQFFAWISHDLRTPLAGIRAMAEALEAGTAPDPARYAATLRSRVDAVNAMVADLFELSKLQSGTIELRLETVELLDLISDAVADVAPVAGRRGIVIEQDGVEGRAVCADAAELTRAVGNLLANSIRHAPDDSVVLVRADQMGERLLLSVIDQGPGVTAQDLGHMFDVGWRTDAARSSDTHGGAGLGLAIVRGIVEAHGGEVEAAHTAQGFSVRLQLPLA